MSSWFSKVFKSPPPSGAPEPAGAGTSEEFAGGFAEEEALLDDPGEFAPRRVLQAPVLPDEASATETAPGGVRIKARLQDMDESVVFLVDRPVLPGYSFVIDDRDTAAKQSLLAGSLFGMGDVASVTLHDTTVTVTRQCGGEPLEDFARAGGARIRAHIESGQPALAPEVLDAMPSEEELRAALQAVIDNEINPGIASHSGLITLDRVTGNTAYITMGGGCQGCAASTITLRHGIERAFRDAAPMLGLLLDQTDHSAGENPYFRELPGQAGF